MRGIELNGRRIRELRGALGLTQQQLASRAECDAKTVRKAEASQRVDVATLVRIAAALEVTIGELIESPAGDLQRANIQVAAAWVEAFNARDPDAVAACFHDDGSIIVLEAISVPGAGEFRGAERVKEWARICFDTYLTEKVTRDMYDADAAGDHVFLRIHGMTVKCLLSGMEIRASIMSEFQILNGKIARLTKYPESGAMERILRG